MEIEMWLLRAITQFVHEKGHTMQYICEAGKIRTTVNSTDELRNILSAVVKEDFGNLHIYQKIGEMKRGERWLYRLLGLSTETVGISAILLTNVEMASIAFLDAAGHEHLAVNRNHTSSSESKKIAFRLDTGEYDYRDEKYVIDKSAATDAIIYFYEHGKRPDWMDYRYTK